VSLSQVVPQDCRKLIFSLDPVDQLIGGAFREQQALTDRLGCGWMDSDRSGYFLVVMVNYTKFGLCCNKLN
jgi:hypothetical protein